MTPHGSARQNPPWLFGLLSLPYGISNAIITILMPFVLRKQGVPVDRIAGVVAIASIPIVWFFVYSPAVDLGLRRRTWILAGSAAGGLCCAGAALAANNSLTLTTALLFLASAATGILASANGALLSTLSPNLRGHASGWLQAGNLGGGAIGGGVAIWLAGVASLPLLSLGVLALVAGPSLAALLVREGAPEGIKSHSPAAVFGLLYRDMRSVLAARQSWIGLIFFLSPVGSAALGNLISSLGPEYHAPDSEVLLVTGIAGGLLSASGAFLGGHVCSRVNRMVTYALAGGSSAIFSVYLAAARPTAFAFGAGYSGYAVTAGFAYAAFTALVLEVLGRRRHAAGTAYSVMIASGNLPIVYMTWLDGVGYKHWGLRGLMGVDAVANGGGAIVLLAVAWYVRRWWQKVGEEEGAAT